MRWIEAALERLPTRARSIARRLVYLPADTIDLILPRRKLRPPRGLTDVGAEDFLKVGERYRRHFVELCCLEPSQRVLDVGCGIGRMAIPLTEYLKPPGSYDGFDVRPADIRWCRRNITARHPHFSFCRVDVKNRAYWPQGTVDPADLRFPYPDGSFDLAVACSLFTHLLTPAAANYLREIARVLAPGGRLFATFFLLNPEVEGLASQGLGRFRFQPYDDHAWVHDASNPEGVVGYPEDTLRAALLDVGLTLEEPLRYGLWSGRDPAFDFQDIVIATRVKI